MNLSFSIIQEALAKDVRYVSPDPNRLFEGVRMAEGAFSAPGYFLIYESSAESKAPASPGILVSGKEEAILMLETIQAVFDYYNDWQSRMQSLILTKASLQSILDVASQVLNNPLAVFDSAYQTLFYAGDIHGDLSGSVWDSVINKGYFSQEEYTPDVARDTYQNLLKRNVILYDPHYRNGERHAAAALFQNNRMFAYIGSCDINSPLSPGQIELLQAVRNFLEIAFETNGEYQIFSDEETYYMDRLLLGEPVESSQLTFFLQKHNWSAADRFRILTVDASGLLDDQRPNLAHITLRLKLLFPDSVVTSLSDRTLVTLIHSVPSDPFKEKENALKDLLTRNHLSAGASTFFHDIMDISVAHLQSKMAMKHAEEGTVQQFQTNYTYYLLSTLQETGALQAFCYPALYAYWEEQGRTYDFLLQTIEQMLLSGGNISLTAERLHVHRNTLHYRLERIEDILGLDLRQVAQQPSDFPHNQLFSFLVSCRILSYLTEKDGAEN